LATQLLASVVIPTYNRAQLLRRTIESVGEQDYRPLEVVVVDDASDDDTGLVVEHARDRLAERGIELRSHVLPGKSGVAVARNTGLRLSHGSLVSFLDSDDLWRPAFLSTLVGLLQRYPTAAVAFSGHNGIDIDDDVVEEPRPDLGTASREGVLRTPFERLVRSFPYATSATLVRRSALDTVGWFDESLPSWEDADLWLRIAKRFDFAYTLEPLACYRLHASSMRSRHLDWHTEQLHVWLRHLDDVHDPDTRRIAVEQIRRSQVLLQEQLLRVGSGHDEYRSLLYNEFAPTSARYRLGRLVVHGPSWLGRSYAAAIRAVGSSSRAVSLARRVGLGRLVHGTMR